MRKKEKILLLFISFLLFLVIFSDIVNVSEVKYTGYNNINENLKVSDGLEGIENIVITQANREANISAHGLMFFEDILKVKNLNNHPISSIFIGIPINLSEDLVFYEATGINQNTLLAERSNMIMNGHEMIRIYFNSPLLPHQTQNITFNHLYKDIASYGFSEITQKQFINISMTVFPLVPYKLEGEISALFWCPESATGIHSDWGFVIPEIFRVSFVYSFIKDEIGSDFITPFLENIGDYRIGRIDYNDTFNTKLEITEIVRDIFISPWGIIKVNEEFSLKNKGLIDIWEFALNIPQSAKRIFVYDSLGEIGGTNVADIGTPGYKGLFFNLIDPNLGGNRARIIQNSTFKFNVEYYLPFENHASLNWFQESIQIDLFTTIFDYLGRKQTINVIIDGAYRIDSITESPIAIQTSAGVTILTYTTDYVTPQEQKVVQFTFTIDLFDILLRPIILIIIFSLIASAYVVFNKTRKREADIAALERKFIPVNEIREFCSLYEEKNALMLEIRQAEEDARRKKMAKKKYKNIVTKNTSKIDEIQKEIIPFKKALMEINETFENIVKRLDVLEAERISVKDSLTLLESRYKRGRLPSRAAYQKLSDDFKKRRKKIDRTIDKLVQQLRSYLL